MRQYSSDIFSNHLSRWIQDDFLSINYIADHTFSVSIYLTANMYKFYAKFTAVNTRRMHEMAKNIC